MQNLKEMTVSFIYENGILICEVKSIALVLLLLYL